MLPNPERKRSWLDKLARKYSNRRFDVTTNLDNNNNRDNINRNGCFLAVITWSYVRLTREYVRLTQEILKTTNRPHEVPTLKKDRDSLFLLITERESVKISSVEKS